MSDLPPHRGHDASAREANGSNASHTNLSSARFFLATVVFLDSFGLAVVLPVLPELIKGFGDFSTGEAALLSGYMVLAYAGLQFLLAPTIGFLSDRFGRRPILLLSLLGLSVSYLVIAVAPNIVWLFVGRAVSGFFGSTVAVANSAVIEVSPESERIKSLGTISGALGLGVICGPIIGGLIGQFSLRMPFVFACCSCLCALAYGYAKFVETRQPSEFVAITLKQLVPLRAFSLFMTNRTLRRLFLAVFLVQLANQSFIAIWPFFTIEISDWTPLQIGVSASVYGAVLAMVQMGLSGQIASRFSEVAILSGSLLISLLAYSGLVIARSDLGLYVCLLLGGLAGLTGPAFIALLSKQVAADTLGRLNGVIVSLYSLSTIIAPILYAYVFLLFTDQQGVYSPGAPFALSGILVLISLLVLISFSIAVGGKRNTVGTTDS